VPFLSPNITVFEGKPKNELTIFLDFILTKYFRKRDVRDVKTGVSEAISGHTGF